MYLSTLKINTRNLLKIHKLLHAKVKLFSLFYLLHLYSYKVLKHLHIIFHDFLKPCAVLDSCQKYSCIRHIPCLKPKILLQKLHYLSVNKIYNEVRWLPHRFCSLSTSSVQLTTELIQCIHNQAGYILLRNMILKSKFVIANHK